METTQDKLIREKLNSLDTLPEEYSLSLDSKWELLMAGQPEKKGDKKIWWYAVAASLLLLFGFSFIFFSSENQPQVPQIASINENNPQKLNNTQTSISGTPAIQKKELAEFSEKAERKPNEVAQNGILKTSKTQVVENKPILAEIKIAKISSLPPSSATQLPSSEPVATEPILVASEISKPALKKNSRFVEMDFDTPVSLNAKPEAVQTAQLNIKIKLLPKAQNTGTEVVQNEKPLRLQHTF